jgi:hypothetical protein
MALVIGNPRLSRRVRLPEAVGLPLSGVVLGPHVLDVFPREHPVVALFSELGRLLLMFFAGLEINVTLFRQKKFRPPWRVSPVTTLKSACSPCRNSSTLERKRRQTWLHKSLVRSVTAEAKRCRSTKSDPGHNPLLGSRLLHESGSKT